jgi:hypothetical protein
MAGRLYVIGEDIPANSLVTIGDDGKLYSAEGRDCAGIGEAVETLRAGFRAYVDGLEVREDDA